MTPLRSLGLTAAALLMVLTYLLIEGAAPDAARNERILDSLRAATLNDPALQRDVLQARAGFLRNYDSLVRSVGTLRHAAADLRIAGQIARGGMRAEIDREVAAGAAAVDVAASLDRLAALPIQENERESIRNLVAHGQLIIATLPGVNDLVAR